MVSGSGLELMPADLEHDQRRRNQQQEPTGDLLGAGLGFFANLGAAF
jgi:hypothetical protein